MNNNGNRTHKLSVIFTFEMNNKTNVLFDQKTQIIQFKGTHSSVSLFTVHNCLLLFYLVVNKAICVRKSDYYYYKNFGRLKFHSKHPNFFSLRYSIFFLSFSFLFIFFFSSFLKLIFSFYF